MRKHGCISDGKNPCPMCEPMTANPSDTNAKYGLTENFQHDLDSNEVCKKCHKHISKLTMKVCPVVGVDEFARYRVRGDDE